MYKNKKANHKKAKIIVVAVLLIAIVATVIINISLARRNTPASDAVTSNEQTTSTVPSAQEDFSDGNEREPGNTEKENRGSGSIVDTGGSSQGSSNDPIISTSGEITVLSPAKNASLESGFNIYGQSTLTSVYFRLVDNISGVIASGNLKVVDGRFSGKLNFETGATEGRIDVFGRRADQTEFSNISIPVRLK